MTQNGSLTVLLVGLLLAQGCFLFHEGPPFDSPDPGDPPAPYDPPDPRDPPPTGEPLVHACPADDVRFFDCDDCDAPEQYYWNGSYCELTNRCECFGPDCGALHDSFLECEEANVDCFNELCASTGGEPSTGCQNSECGELFDSPCFRAGPICICPSDTNFIPGYGCVRDPECGAPLPDVHSLCEATGGEPDRGCCSTVCGDECDRDCDDETDICRCGPFEVFNARLGCIRGTGCAENSEACEVSDDCGPEMTCTDGICSGFACLD